ESLFAHRGFHAPAAGARRRPDSESFAQWTQGGRGSGVGTFVQGPLFRVRFGAITPALEPPAISRHPTVATVKPDLAVRNRLVPGDRLPRRIAVGPVPCPCARASAGTAISMRLVATAAGVAAWPYLRGFARAHRKAPHKSRKNLADSAHKLADYPD